MKKKGEAMRQSAFLGTLGDLGALSDDPSKLADLAVKRWREERVKAAEAFSAGDTEGVKAGAVALRLTAELAALALDSAVEVAIGREIHSDGARKIALADIAAAVSKGLFDDVEETRHALHSACYHGARCDSAGVEVGLTPGLVTKILSARGRVLPQRSSAGRVKRR